MSNGRPQMSRLLPFMLLVAVTSVSAAKFVSAAVDPAQKNLIITGSDGRTIDPPRVTEQVGFENALISQDGKYVGWLALHPNCCTSYPVPLTLVVLDQDGRHREFRGPQAIFSWCFLPARKSVAYRQAVLHGPSETTFELRQIDDGRLLSRFVQPWDYRTQEPAKVRLPTWAQCAAN